MFAKRGVLPGFGLTFGFTVLWLSALVLVPLSFLFLRAASLSWPEFVRTVTEPRALASYRVTLFTSLAAATLNALAGPVVAWTLVRFDFPGRRLLDAIVDLPFALPTAVSGIALTAVYAKNGWIGSWLDKFGVAVAFTPIGIIVALTFIGLPFVVRTLQPVLAEMSKEAEEAAATLGASRAQTFRRVILPRVFPSLLTGAALAFARGVGEYGSVIFIAGNLPGVSEIAPLLIIIKLNENDYAGAAVIGVIMLAISFVMLLMLNLLQAWTASQR